MNYITSTTTIYHRHGQGLSPCESDLVSSGLATSEICAIFAKSMTLETRSTWGWGAKGRCGHRGERSVAEGKGRS